MDKSACGEITDIESLLECDRRARAATESLIHRVLT
jgi:hypothetical protein